MSTKGKGDAVVIYSGATGTAVFTHGGTGNFAINSYSDSGADLLVNEIGKYSGENVMPAGPTILAITADGSWSVSVTS